MPRFEYKTKPGTGSMGNGDLNSISTITSPDFRASRSIDTAVIDACPPEREILHSCEARAVNNTVQLLL